MSVRERWIIYPILFLTLGIALRDKITPPSRLQAKAITTPRLRCNELQVARLVCDQLDSRQLGCNALVVNGPNNQPVVVAKTDNNGRAGMIETYTTGGLPQVRIFSSDVGGSITAIERNAKLALILGDTGQSFGLFAELPGLGQLVPLTLPWRSETKPTPKPQTIK